MIGSYRSGITSSTTNGGLEGDTLDIQIRILQQKIEEGKYFVDILESWTTILSSDILSQSKNIFWRTFPDTFNLELERLFKAKPPSIV